MLLAGNWKAYVDDLEKAKQLVAAGKRVARSGHEVVAAPPTPFIGTLARTRGEVALAAQDLSTSTGGAATGEVTAGALASAGASWAIIGHSERRARGETNEVAAEKLGHALAHDLTPILCVGERERDPDGRYLGFIREEVERALAPFTQKERGRVVIAYEPIWAIGKPAEDAMHPDDLTEMALYLRKVLADLLPGKNAARARILYGGSVDATNVRALAEGTGIDGFLIGRASTDPDAFVAIAKAL